MKTIATCSRCKAEVIADRKGNMVNHCKCGSNIFTVGVFDGWFLDELKEMCGYSSYKEVKRCFTTT